MDEYEYTTFAEHLRRRYFEDLSYPAPELKRKKKMKKGTKTKGKRIKY